VVTEGLPEETSFEEMEPIKTVPAEPHDDLDWDLVPKEVWTPIGRGRCDRIGKLGASITISNDVESSPTLEQYNFPIEKCKDRCLSTDNCVYVSFNGTDCSLFSTCNVSVEIPRNESATGYQTIQRPIIPRPMPVMVKPVMPLKDWRNYTAYNYSCLDTGSEITNYCGTHNSSYSWCNVNSTVWDYCVSNADTSKGWLCENDGSNGSTCGFWGEVYTWCWTVNSSMLGFVNWDYCVV
jgi:hypothetical protein